MENLNKKFNFVFSLFVYIHGLGEIYSLNLVPLDERKMYLVLGLGFKQLSTTRSLNLSPIAEYVISN